MTAPGESRYCMVCGALLRFFQKTACSIDCAAVLKRRKKQADYKSLRLNELRTTVKQHRKGRKIYETDAQQLAIKRAIDDKYSILDAGRVLRPGHPDFNAVCADIMARRKRDGVV